MLSVIKAWLIKNICCCYFNQSLQQIQQNQRKGSLQQQLLEISMVHSFQGQNLYKLNSPVKATTNENDENESRDQRKDYQKEEITSMNTMKAQQKYAKIDKLLSDMNSEGSSPTNYQRQMIVSPQLSGVNPFLLMMKQNLHLYLLPVSNATATTNTSQPQISFNCPPKLQRDFIAKTPSISSQQVSPLGAQFQLELDEMHQHQTVHSIRDSQNGCNGKKKITFQMRKPHSLNKENIDQIDQIDQVSSRKNHKHRTAFHHINEERFYLPNYSFKSNQPQSLSLDTVLEMKNSQEKNIQEIIFHQWLERQYQLIRGEEEQEIQIVVDSNLHLKQNQKGFMFSTILHKMEDYKVFHCGNTSEKVEKSIENKGNVKENIQNSIDNSIKDRGNSIENIETNAQKMNIPFQNIDKSKTHKEQFSGSFYSKQQRKSQVQQPDKKYETYILIENINTIDYRKIIRFFNQGEILSKMHSFNKVEIVPLRTLEEQIQIPLIRVEQYSERLLSKNVYYIIKEIEFIQEEAEINQSQKEEINQSEKEEINQSQKEDFVIAVLDYNLHEETVFEQIMKIHVGESGSVEIYAENYYRIDGQYEEKVFFVEKWKDIENQLRQNLIINSNQ